MAGPVPHKHHFFSLTKRRHLLLQRQHQLRVIIMAAQQGNPQRQARKQRAHTLYFTNYFFVLVTVNDVQRLNSHILIPLLRQLLQGLQRRVDVNAVALFELADDHPGGKCPKQVTVRATGRKIALTGHNIFLTGVVIAGAKADHQKRLFHL
ncbi:hypothetical protein D3C73_1053910 [compost metagenome]